jgi:hypothetical protein
MIVRTHLLEERADGVEEVVEVALVLVVIEATARVAELIRLAIALRLEDEAGLEKRLADVAVDLLEPLAELGVLARVLDEDVRGVPHDVRARAVREACEQVAELTTGGVEALVGAELVVAVLAMAGDGLRVASVLLDVAEEPLDGLLVVVVLLAFDDDLSCGEYMHNEKGSHRR